MFVLKVVGDAGLTFRCPPLRPLQPGGSCSPVGWWASPPLGAGKLPLFLQPSPGAPAPLPSPPLLSSLPFPFTSSSFSPHPLRPLDVTPGTSLFCASVSSPKTWDEEKQPPGVAGGGRSEAGGRNHESANEQRRWNCSGLSSLQFFTPQVPTPPLLGSLFCCANLDPRL